MAPGALFVYGTLRFPEVLHALLGRLPDTSPARVAGWLAVRLPGRPYPALVASPNPLAEAQGLLVECLSPNEWRVLDDFEDKVYDLTPLRLSDDRTGWAYVCPDPGAATSEQWDYDAFAQHDLLAYVQVCRAWIDRRMSIKLTASDLGTDATSGLSELGTADP